MSAVPLRKAEDPLVLALDFGSGAARGRLFDATGTAVRGTRHRVPHTIATDRDGAAVLDPDAVFANVMALIDAVLDSRALQGRIEGVAMDTIASTLLGVDEGGTPLTPCLTYADARAAPQVAALRREFDEAEVQQRTGCRFSASYWPAQLRWLRETQPDLVERVDRWLSLGEYLSLRLAGACAASYSIAAWTGLLDRHVGRWDEPLLAAAGARPGQFSAIRDTTQPLDGAGSFAAQRWPALERARWFPPVADGYASTIGSGVLDATTLALAAGTSGALRVLVDGVPPDVPSGLWCYRVDRRRSLYGGALNDAGRLADWLRETLRLPGEGELDAALLAPPGATTPAVLPFLTGERSPGWAAGATAAFAGITATTGPLDLWRGAMEGLALRYALIAEEIAIVAPAAERVIASGNVVESTPGWLQIVADALGRSVAQAGERNATLLGAALIALEVLAPGRARAPAVSEATHAPIAEHAEHYRAARARQHRIYNGLVAEERPS